MTIPAGYGQATFVYTGSAVPNGAAWTMGFSSSGFAGSVQAAADSIRDSWVEEFAPLTNINTRLDHVLVKFGPDATGPSAISTSLQLGGVNDPPSPAAVALLVRKQTALGGRQGRGRFYLPGLWDGAIDGGGLVLAGTVTAFQGACDDFLGKMAADGLDCYLLHDGALAPTAITSLSVQGVVATQRRRQRR